MNGCYGLRITHVVTSSTRNRGMIDLSKVIEPFESGGTQLYRLREFQCEHCGQAHSESDFNKAAFYYGVYFLIGSKDGYLGTKCINTECTKTLSFKGNQAEIDIVKNHLFSMLDFGQIQLPSANFRYYPPIKYLPEYDDALKHLNVQYFFSTGIDQLTATEVDQEVERFEMDDPHLEKEFYRTYVYGCDKPIGNFLSVMWFEPEQVENLIKTENEKQIRIFPRYIPHDYLYEEILHFCWKYYFYERFCDKKSFSVNTNIGDQNKRIASKCYDFSLILDYAPYPDFRFSSFVTSTHSFSYLQRLIDEINISDQTNINDDKRKKRIEKIIKDNFIKHEIMTSKLWENYHDDFTQEQLSKMSTDFIHKYISIAHRLDFSYETLWELKENYLKDLFNSYKSRYKKAQIKRLSSEKEQKIIAEECPAFSHIFSCDHKINNGKQYLNNIAKSPKKNKIILLLGESGTGKDLFAEGIHWASERKDMPFIPLNCGDLSDDLFVSELFGHKKGAFTDAYSDKSGKFESADRGTIFLDEIGNLSKNNQGKLLRVLNGDKREFYQMGGDELICVDVTTVLATNKNLADEVAKDNFRFDLYQRIKPLNYHIPSLTERDPDDLELLLKYFVQKEAGACKKSQLKSIGITKEALRMIKKHPWPGNVRELEGMLTSIIAPRDENDTSDISVEEVVRALELDESMSSDISIQTPNKLNPAAGKRKMPPKETIVQYLDEAGGNQRQVAVKIGVSPEHFYREVKKMGITIKKIG